MNTLKFYLAILLFVTNYTFGQVTILTRAEVEKFLPENVRQKFKIDYNLFRVYTYLDKAGENWIVLTEKIDSITPTGDTLSGKIKAFRFSNGVNKFEKEWEINDTILKGENTILFWTKYCDFKDVDGDGIIDPILVYGTRGINDLRDGRLNILFIYQDQKIAIWHQNGVLDLERNTQVDAAFYILPLSVQEYIKEIMQKIETNAHAIFPYGWKEAMNDKRLKFDEKH